MQELILIFLVLKIARHLLFYGTVTREECLTVLDPAEWKTLGEIVIALQKLKKVQLRPHEVNLALNDLVRDGLAELRLGQLSPEYKSKGNCPPKRRPSTERRLPWLRIDPMPQPAHVQTVVRVFVFLKNQNKKTAAWWYMPGVKELWNYWFGKPGRKRSVLFLSEGLKR